LLTPDGRFEPVDPGSSLLPGPPCVWLARGLCAHAVFDPGPARGAAAWAAARLHARTAAPFLEAGARVERSGGGFSIWWWDQALVGPALAARFGDHRPPLAPETFQPPAADGWRVLRLGAGFEAQLWRGGGLAVSAWRRAPFDTAAWHALTRSLAAQGEAPRDPPDPIVAPRAAFPRTRPLEDLLAPRRLLARAPAIAAVLLLTATAFWLGQGLRLRSLAEDSEKVVALERAAAPPPAASARTATRRLAAFQALADRPRVLDGLAVAVRVLQLYGMEIEAVDAQGDELTLTLPHAAIGGIDRIAREMEATGAFTDVRPISNAADRTIQLRLRLVGT